MSGCTSRGLITSLQIIIVNGCRDLPGLRGSEQNLVFMACGNQSGEATYGHHHEKFDIDERVLARCW